MHILYIFEKDLSNSSEFEIKSRNLIESNKPYQSTDIYISEITVLSYKSVLALLKKINPTVVHFVCNIGKIFSIVKVCSELNIPVIVSVDNDIVSRFETKSKFRKIIFFNKYKKNLTKLLSSTSVIIVPNVIIARQVRSIINNNTKIYIVKPSLPKIDSKYKSISKIKTKFGFDQNDFILFYYGGHAVTDRFDRMVLLMRKLEQLKQIKLIVIGWDKDALLWQKRLESTQLKNNIFWFGRVDRQARDELIRISHLIIFPKVTDNFNYLCIIAMRYGLVPIVVKSSIQDYLIHAYNSFLVPGYTSAIFEAVKRLYLKRTILKYLSNNAKKIQFGDSTYKEITQLARIYQSLIS